MCNFRAHLDAALCETEKKDGGYPKGDVLFFVRIFATVTDYHSTVVRVIHTELLRRSVRNWLRLKNLFVLVAFVDVRIIQVKVVSMVRNI